MNDPDAEPPMISQYAKKRLTHNPHVHIDPSSLKKCAWCGVRRIV